MPNPLISELKSNLGLGSRKNKYILVLNLPPPINSGQNQKKISVLCKSVSLNSKNASPIEIWYQGQLLRIVNNVIFDGNLSLVFSDSDKNEIRTMFNKWIDFIYNSRELMRDSTSHSDYMVGGELKHLNGKNETITTYKLYDVFPISLNDVEFSNEENDTLSEINVEFILSNWEII